MPKGYTVLESVGDVVAGSSVSFPQYLQGAFKFLILVAVVSAVMMLVVAGVQYISAGATANEKTAGAAKERFWAVITGLVLALVSFLILKTINPALTDFNLGIDPVSVPGSAISVASGGKPIPPARASSFEKNVDPHEAQIRQRLRDAGVQYNTEQSCLGMTFQQFNAKYRKGCTDLAGLQEGTIQGVIRLKNECGGCSVRVSAGSEDGHKTHSDGLHLDLSKGPELDTYIKRGIDFGKSGGDQVYGLLGIGKCVDERGGTAPHWHCTF